ncbi:MAG: methyltransferase MtaB domain-containing protein, partial [Eubacteriales bacterium]
TVSFEQLTYDCRLMNTASARGRDTAILLRDLHADSDSGLDPQAYVLRPDVVLEISKELVKEKGYYARIKKAAALSLEKIEKAYKEGQLTLDDKEQMWMDRMGEDIAALPADVDTLTENMIPQCEKLDPAKYDMA